jgi:hypothetical protein
MKYNWPWWGGCLLLALVACGHPDAAVEPAFYHWKTRYSPTATEHETLQTLGVGKLYVKYFDIDWPDDATRALPQAKVDFAQAPQAQIVPTVFITNRAIQKTGEAESRALADNLYRLIMDLHPTASPPPREVQIDCDWTAGTRAAYFALLERLGQRLDSSAITLSATIRLHQVKYPKQTGVPPVDRGMLMFYNMGDLDNPGEDNSILDVAEGKRYVGNLDAYQLPLDIALPIFAWGVLIRQAKPIQLLNNLRLESTTGLPWLTQLGDHRFRVDTSHYLGGHYLYAGDELRLEEVTPSALHAAANLLAQELPIASRTIAFYHLDSLTLRHYRVQTLDSVLAVFGE